MGDFVSLASCDDQRGKGIVCEIDCVQSLGDLDSL